MPQNGRIENDGARLSADQRRKFMEGQSLLSALVAGTDRRSLNPLLNDAAVQPRSDSTPTMQRPNPSVPQVRATQSDTPAIQPSERSVFDLAGRFHDFQAGPKIARPNLAEELIPVVGPAWDAAADLQDGHYGSAAFNAGMAALDLLPVGVTIKAFRNASKITRALRTITPKAEAVQRKIHQMGLASRGDDVHHIFELNHMDQSIPSKMRRKVENWRNNPMFLKVLPRETHRRLHTRYLGKEKFGLLPRLWHGTTDWMKAGAAGLAGYDTDLAENLVIRPRDAQQSAPPAKSRSGGIFPSPYLLLP